MDFSLLQLSFLGGAIRRVEEKLKRPLLWCICLLHTTERVFAKYFIHCDNCGKDIKSTSPSYDGIIGSQFKNGLELKPIVKFKTVDGKVLVYDNDFIASFNNDKKYFYQICHAIQNGWEEFPPWLVNKLVGKVHKAR